MTSPPLATGATGATGADLGVTGTWPGTWQDAAGASGTFTMQFAQTGNQISGPITIEGSTCVSQGTISGTIDGDQITFGAVKAGNSVDYTGTISGDTMSGTWASPACGGDSGTWEAIRT